LGQAFRNANFLNDFARDCKSQPCATLLRRKVRQEKSLAHLVGQSGACVGDGQFDHAVIEQAG